MKVVIKLSKSVQIIDPQEILYLQANGSYSLIKKLDGEIIKVSKNLLEVNELFQEHDQLKKCHRSYIANIAHVNSIIFAGAQKYKVLFNNKETIPLSLSLKKQFVAQLANQ